MAYIDKTLWYDQDDRYIQTENKKEGWDWDFDKVSIRSRSSDGGEQLVSLELWDSNGDAQEVMLTKQNAMRLADTLKMAVIEFTVEDMMEFNTRRIEEIDNQMDWLRPVIDEEIEKWKTARKEARKEENV